MIVLTFIFKLILITYSVDFYLYWVHRAFHSHYFPWWFRRWHMQHHTQFHKSEVFSLHPVEFLIDFIGVGGMTYLLVDWWFIPVVVGWGLFEAARGHNHFKWFKLIPRSYYKFFRFCGSRYHLEHHAPGGETTNLGQMLRIWDDICGTKAPQAARQPSPQSQLSLNQSSA